MFDKCKTGLIWFGTLGSLALPLAAANSPVPGTVNYIEGQVSMDGRRVTDAGRARLEPNGVLETASGKAELLLTPGVFLRIGDNSAVRMVSPGLTNTEVQLIHGEATIEVAQLFKENNIRVSVDHTVTTLEKPGLYAFNTDQQMVRVFDGKAMFTTGDQSVELKKGHEVSPAGPLKAQKFDTKKSEDSLYAWSNLRSEYEAQASMGAARTVVVGAPGWYGPGWYWNPWWNMYGFVPGAGLIYSPFGYPFYSPVVVYRAPVFGYRGFVRSPAARIGSVGSFRAGSFARAGGFRR